VAAAVGRLTFHDFTSKYDSRHGGRRQTHGLRLYGQHQLRQKDVYLTNSQVLVGNLVGLQVLSRRRR
jgi:hypothetical protein